MVLAKFTAFTRGGQMTMHAWRMIGQASKAVIQFTLILSAAVYILFFLCFSNPYGRYLVKEFLINEFYLSLNNDHYYKYIFIKTPDRRVGSITAGKFINNQDTLWAVKRLKIAAWQALAATTVSSILIFLLVIKIFMARSKKISNIQTIRGARFVEDHLLAKLIKKEAMHSDLKLAGVPLINKSETQHILFTGTTGSGKSVALTELMDQVRNKNQKAIVYDGDGSFIATYYNPDKDLILNPLDQRSPFWNVWQECRDQADFEAFAESLMPMHLSGGDPFWIKGSRLILSSAAFSMRNQNPTTKKLLTLLLTENLEGIKEQLKNTVAETLVSDKIEKTALSIKATLSTYCKSLAYLPDETKASSLFSIREWIRDDSNNGWLFISTNKEKASAMRPLISAWLDLAVRSILSLDRNIDRRVWFFMDELPSLYELPSLKEVLAEGRKYGACFVATIQDIHQLRTIYGREATEALLSFFNTKVCFRTESTESAIWAERSMGSQEIIEMREGFSYGANDIRDGVTLNQERRKTPVVMDAQVMNLNDLEAYLKLPGNFPVTKIKFKYKERTEIATQLVERETKDLLIEGDQSNGSAQKNPASIRKNDNNQKSNRKNKKVFEKPESFVGMEEI